MIELKTTPPGAKTPRAQELGTQGGMVELRVFVPESHAGAASDFDEIDFANFLEDEP